MKSGELIPLCEELVQQCIDDRTVDFTLALMDFAKWHHALEPNHALASRSSESEESEDGDDEEEGSKEGEGSPNSSVALSSPSHYLWPAFILTMLKKPIEWASWRKRVERAILSNREPGRRQNMT